MAIYKMSYICAVFNVVFLLSSFAVMYFETSILAGVFILGMMFSPLVSVAGILLGIVALALKEPYKKSVIAIVLNIACSLLVVFFIFKPFL